MWGPWWSQWCLAQSVLNISWTKNVIRDSWEYLLHRQICLNLIDLRQRVNQIIGHHHELKKVILVHFIAKVSTHCLINLYYLLKLVVYILTSQFLSIRSDVLSLDETFGCLAVPELMLDLQEFIQNLNFLGHCALLLSYL
jgi:hypothetical protein